MGNERRLAGIGGLAFTVLLVIATVSASPPGGEYEASDVADFVAKDHRTVVILSLFLIAAAMVGLLMVMAYLCETSFGSRRSGRIAWGTSLLAIGAFLTGWAIVLAPAMSITVGGGPDVDPAVAYTIMQAGFGVFLAVSCLFLGISFLTLALAGSAAPTWVRIVTGIVGLLAFAAMAFVPVYAVLLWGLVVGIWLLVSPARDTAPADAAPAA